MQESAKAKIQMNKTRFHKIIIAVASLFLVPITKTCASQAHDFTVPADANYVRGELLVRFAPAPNGTQQSREEINEILTPLGGGTLERVFKTVPGAALVKLPGGLTVEQALKTFNKATGILYAEPNYELTAISMLPNDPNFPQLWAMHNTGQTGGTPDADIGAPEAWNLVTDSNVIVAVIDSGID